MRRLFALISLLVFVTLSTSAQIAYVTGSAAQSNYSGSEGTTFNLGLGASVAANGLIVAITDMGTAGTFSSVTDSASNTYHPCPATGQPYNDSGNSNIYEYYTVPSASGAPTVHFNATGGFSGYWNVFVAGFTGENTSTPCDAGTGQSAGTSATSWTTNSFNTGCVNETLVAGIVSSTGTHSPSGGGGYTSLAVNEGFIFGYQSYTSKQTSDAMTATVSVASPYTGIIAGFCAATQPAASANMPPVILTMLARFWPGFLHLNSWFR